MADSATASSSTTTSATPRSFPARRRRGFRMVCTIVRIENSLFIGLTSGQESRYGWRHRLQPVGDADAHHAPDKEDVPGRHVQQGLGRLLERLREMIFLLRSDAQ